MCQTQLDYNIFVFSADLLTPPSRHPSTVGVPTLPLKGAELGRGSGEARGSNGGVYTRDVSAGGGCECVTYVRRGVAGGEALVLLFTFNKFY